MAKWIVEFNNGGTEAVEAEGLSVLPFDYELSYTTQSECRTTAIDRYGFLGLRARVVESTAYYPRCHVAAVYPRIGVRSIIRADKEAKDANNARGD